jgi:hypothetical protein
MFCSYCFYSFADDPIFRDIRQRGADDDALLYVRENGSLEHTGVPPHGTFELIVLL